MDLWVQLTILGICKGSMWALIAVSFALIFVTTRTFHLAHGAVFTATAYCFYWFTSLLKLPAIPATVLVLIIAVSMGVFIEAMIYQPLRVKFGSGVILMIASMAILIMTPGIVAIVFGDKSVWFPSFPIGPFAIGNISVPGQLLAMLTLWIPIGLVIFSLERSGTGKVLRAVKDAPNVAPMVGIEVSRANLVATAIGSALLVPAVLVYGYDISTVPGMGFRVILIAVAGAIVGGLASLTGAALGGFIIGFLMHMSIGFITSGWQEAIVFGILVAVLLLRPQGILRAR